MNTLLKNNKRITKRLARRLYRATPSRLLERRLRIAIQKKGRLYEDSVQVLAQLGLVFEPNGGLLVQSCRNAPIDILLLRDDDIPGIVEKGAADFGIVGKNVVLESQTSVEAIRDLPFGRCRLMIAAPSTMVLESEQALQGKKIATTYPNMVRQYLADMAIDAEVVTIAGSAEIAPQLGIADVICDLVQTGATLKEHGLAPLFTVMDSHAQIITNSHESITKRAFLQRITTFL